MRARYYAKEFSPGRWHVIAPDGIPIYDDAPNGKDKPIVFTDEDVAVDVARQCNEQEEAET